GYAYRLVSPRHQRVWPHGVLLLGTARTASPSVDSKLRDGLELPEEGPCAPWSPPLLGFPCARTAHENNRSSRKDDRCVE
ncbi:hypothetical protein EDB84DRAFT_1576902, partial [Lactarius hengduanensis]